MYSVTDNHNCVVKMKHIACFSSFFDNVLILYQLPALFVDIMTE